MNKKVFLLTGGIGSIILAIIYVILTFNNIDSDEVIEQYRKALNQTRSLDYYDIKEEIVLTNFGEADTVRINQYCRNDENYLIAQGDSNIMVMYDGYRYTLLKNNDGKTRAKKEKETGYDMEPLHTIDSSYYSINAEDVIYEETEDGYVVIYRNKAREGSVVRGFEKTAPDGYETATSKCYFDTDWNLKEIEVYETWNTVLSDNNTYKRERVITVTYKDTSKEQIIERLKKERDMINNYIIGE